MIPNNRAKLAGMTKRDGQDLERAERGIRDGIEVLRKLEDITGETCDELGRCENLLTAATRLRELFFTATGDESDAE